MFCPSNWQKWELRAELNTFYIVSKHCLESEWLMKIVFWKQIQAAPTNTNI